MPLKGGLKKKKLGLSTAEVNGTKEMILRF